MDNPEIILNELLTNDAWIRSLAQSLVADDADADDVAQDAWVAALRNPPRRSGSVPAWIARVVRRIARSQQRAEGERRQREQTVARSVSEDDPGREELRYRVATAVFGLEEPYRSSIYYRYIEDLPPRKIAARLDVTVAAVETRLRRGIQKLRARLDRDFGDRKTWCAALLPVAGLTSGEATAATVGALIMGTKIKVGLVAILLLFGAIAIWSTQGVPPANDDDVASGPEQTAPEAQLSAVREPASTESIVREAEQLSAAPPSTGAVETTATALASGTVVDKNGRPVPGAAVYLLPSKRLQAEWSFAELAAKLGTPVLTDENGRFRIGSRAPQLPKASVVSILAHADGFVARQFERVAIGAHKQRLELHRALALTGYVTRKEDGRPVAGATLTWRARRGPAGTQLGRTRSVADGSFRLEGVPRHTTSKVEVTANGFAPVLFSVPFWKDSVPPITVELAHGRDIEGHVVDGDSLSPIERARVELWVYENAGASSDGWHGYGVRMLARTTTDPNGRFRFRHVEPRGGCAPKGFRLLRQREIGLWIDAEERAPAWIAIDDEGALPKIALYRSGTVRGLVLDRRGRPMSGAFVVARVERTPLVRSELLGTRRFRQRSPFDRIDHESNPPWEGLWCGVTDDDGRYVIRRVAAAQAAGRIVKMKLDSRMSPKVSTRVAVVPGETVVADSMTHPDPPPTWIDCRTVDEDGKPIAGAAVMFRSQRAVTDCGGRFRVQYPIGDIYASGTRVRIWVRHADFATHSVPVSRDWIGKDETRIVLRRGVRLEGTVIDGQGRPVIGAVVRARPGHEPIEIRNGYVVKDRVTSGQTKKSGRFSIGPLPTGVVTVLVTYPARGRPAFSVRASLVAGAPQQIVKMHDLNITALTRVNARFRIVDEKSGKPVNDAATVALWKSGFRCSRSVARAGIAELRDVVAPQVYVVRVEVDGFGTVEREIRIAGFVKEQDHVVAIGGGGGTIRTTIAGLKEQHHALRVLMIAPDGRRFFATPEGTGRFEARGLAPGKYSVRLDSWKLPPAEQVVAVPRTANVSNGATVDITLQATPGARLDVHLLGHGSRPDDVHERVTWRLPSSYRGLPYNEWKRQGVSIQIRDHQGHLWYDGPPNTNSQGILSKSPQPGLRLLVSPGTYDIIVRKRGVVLGRGTATTEVPSSVRADLYR